MDLTEINKLFALYQNFLKVRINICYLTSYSKKWWLRKTWFSYITLPVGQEFRCGLSALAHGVFRGFSQDDGVISRLDLGMIHSKITLVVFIKIQFLLGCWPQLFLGWLEASLSSLLYRPSYGQTGSMVTGFSQRWREGKWGEWKERERRERGYESRERS